MEVREILLEDHVNKSILSPNLLDQFAIRGMIESVQDPYAKYLGESEFQEYLNRLEKGSSSSYVGIGVFVAERAGQILITSVFPNSPAHSAGLLPGDELLSVDSISVADSPLDLVAQMVLGPELTPVSLTIRRSLPNQTSIFTVELIRSQVRHPTAVWSLFDDIGYIAILSFSSVTYSEIEDAITQLSGHSITALIIDLRNNPGGLVTSVIDNSSIFLGGKDKLIGYTVNSKGIRQNWESKDVSIDFSYLPIAILVNQYSASGSEVFASALQYHNESIVIGSQTFGKGSESTVRPLSDGSGVIYSSSHWFTPGDQSINGKGVTPDILIESSDASNKHSDLFINKAIELLSKSIN